MKYLLLSLLMSACSTGAYERGRVDGIHESQDQIEYVMDHPEPGKDPLAQSWEAVVGLEDAVSCLKDQTRLYGDICAEGRDCEGYGGKYCNDRAADKRGFSSLVIESHFEGVKCGTSTAEDCIRGKARKR